jgi:hypothetical protein
LLYQRIVSSSRHGPFIKRIGELLQNSSSRRRLSNVTLAVAPGAFYREHPQTGADGRRIRDVAESLGCRSDMIPARSLGSAELNGRIICDWLLKRLDENIIVCSLSKGGADVKIALATAEAREAFHNVVAWLNVGGTVFGSPTATWLLDRPWLAIVYRSLFAWRGQDFRFIQELARSPGGPLDRPVAAPAHLRIIHVAGFPLRCHIRERRSRRWHRRLSRYGPNDGATLLADCCAPPGLIFPVWGADHYLNARWNADALVTALLQYLGEDLNLLASVPEPARALAS